MENEKALTVVSLDVQNIMRLKAVRLKPSPDGLIIVGGKNGAGKSTLLNSIWMALDGADAVPEEPLRRGSTKANIRLDLGELVVTRKFSSKNTNGALVVKAKDGSTIKRPQEVLDKLTTTLTFDPTEFLRMKDKGKTLRDLLSIDFSDLEKERSELYDKRTEVNREKKTVDSRLEDAPFCGELKDADPVDVDAIKARLSNVQKDIDKKNKLGEVASVRRRDCSDHDQAILECESEITNAKMEIEKWTRVLDQQTEELKELQSRTEALFELRDKVQKEFDDFVVPDIAEIQKEIDQGQEHNRKLKENELALDLQSKANMLDEEVRDLTMKIESIDDAKRERLAKAEYPVDGLSVDMDGAVRYKKELFEQVSTAEALKISLAIGMAMNPDLKIMLIRNGNDLDKESMATVAQMAKENGYQVWMERVADEKKSATVFIEDGEVVEGAEDPCS